MIWSYDGAINRFLIQIAIIISISKTISILLNKYLNQPSVVGDLITRIVLGPTILKNFRSVLFPKQSIIFLEIFGNIGLVLLMYLVGLEVEPNALFRDLHKSFWVSLGGLVIPMGLSCLFIPWYPNQSPIFYVFLGVLMGITAFPVLARIVRESKLLNTEVGHIALGAACVGDILSWICIFIISTLVRNPQDFGGAAIMLGILMLYAIVCWWIFKPLITRYIQNAQEDCPTNGVVIVLVLLFFNSWLASALGSDLIFGAFLTGIITPRSRGFALEIARKLENLINFLFVPLYFAYSGDKLWLDSLNNPHAWLTILLILVVASLGKILGCAGAAYLISKFEFRESITIGILMNTRGLVEYIVLQFGVDSKLIPVEVFGAFVVVNLVTTFSTVPLTNWIYPNSERKAFDFGKDEGNVTPTLQARKILLCLDSKNTVAGISSLLSAIFKDNRSLAIPILHIYALRLINTENTTSNMMLAAATATINSNSSYNDGGDPSTAETFKKDPLMALVRTFGIQNHVIIKSLFTVAPTANFANDILDAASESAADFIILSVKGKQPNLKRKAGTVRLTVGRKQIWPKYVSKLLESNQNSVTVIFVDMGIQSGASGSLLNIFHHEEPIRFETKKIEESKIFSKQKIFVVYRGVYDDECMLNFVSEFANSDIMVVILVCCEPSDISDEVKFKLTELGSAEIIVEYYFESVNATQKTISSVQFLNNSVTNNWEQFAIQRLSLLTTNDYCMIGNTTFETDIWEESSVRSFLENGKLSFFVIKATTRK